MKTLNNIVLEQRRRAMNASKEISQNCNPFKAPLEIKQKNSQLGTYCGAFFIIVCGVFYVFKSYRSM